MSNASAKQRPKVNRNGTKPAPALAINLDDLDLGDTIDIEEVTGTDVGILFGQLDQGKMSAKTMAALIWVVKRRKDPAFSFDDAKATKIVGLDTVMADLGIVTQAE